jgi:dihydrofolate reductase
MTRRKLTAAAFQSLDGVIQGGGTPDEDRSGGFTLGGWNVPLTDDSAGPWMDKLYNQPEYDLLVGKRTYDIFFAYWHFHLEDPIGAKFERINKYVFTHSDVPLTWAHSHNLSGDASEVVRKLKNTGGRDLLLQGSSTLYPPLLAAGLIDRLVLMTFPVVLGKGKRIFDASATPGAFKLVEHFVSDKGVVFATYEPDGEVKTGTFETKPPSEAELERRAEWPK